MNPQIGPAGDQDGRRPPPPVAGAGQPMPDRRDGPGREIEEFDEVTLPNSRALQWVFVLSTIVVDGLTYVTKSIRSAPTGDCGCTLKSKFDFRWCTYCSAVVCLMDAAMCQKCNRWRCLSCLEWYWLNGYWVSTCNSCRFDLQAGWLKKFWRWLRAG